MSTDYRPLTSVRFTGLFDGRLGRFGVTERVDNQTTDMSRCLTDGNSYLWTYSVEGGRAFFARHHSRYGAPGRILSAVAEAFDTKIVSEHEPEYWGKTQEEWDRAGLKKHDARFYEELMKYVLGEEHDLRPGSLGERWAENAKALISENPALALPANKADLLDAVQDDTRFTVRLDEKEMAAAEMWVTHESDLPKA